MMMMPRKVSAARFLDVALSEKGPCSFSYHHHHHHHHQHDDLKWLIRKDLLALLRDFPSLSLCAIPTSPPSSITTNTLNLLAASGPLPDLPSQLLDHLTIILHPSHPLHPPFVFVARPSPSPSPTPTPSPSPSTPFSTPSLLHKNPFVDPHTGSTTTPYLLTWQHPSSNLPDLVRNLVNIFTFWPVNSPRPHLVRRPHRFKTTTVSRREAIDRLSMHLLSDKVSFDAAVKEDVDALFLHLKPMLSGRSAALKEAMQVLEDEATTLGSTVEEATTATVEMEEWLSSCASNLKDFSSFSFSHHEEAEEEEEKQKEEDAGNDHDDNNNTNNSSCCSSNMVLDVFQGADERSEQMLEHRTADLAIDDVMNVLEKELDRGAVCLRVYLKEIRVLAKEQFHHRNLYLKLAANASPCRLGDAYLTDTSKYPYFRWKESCWGRYPS